MRLTLHAYCIFSYRAQMKSGNVLKFKTTNDYLEKAKRRASELDNGVVKAVPADEVMAKARALLQSINAS